MLAADFEGPTARRYGLEIEFGDSDRHIQSRREQFNERNDRAGDNRSWLSTVRSQPNSPRDWKVDETTAAIDGATLHRFHARTMAIPSAIKPAVGFRLERDGFGLPTLLDDIRGFDVRAYIQLEDALKYYFPHIIRLRVETAKGYDRTSMPDDPFAFNYRQVEFAKEVSLDTISGSIRLQQASDGLVLFLGFLALARAPRPPRMILIEEPENGIYPRRLDEVVRMIKRFVSETPNAPQVIMSTHSPYLMSEFTLDEITFMSRQTDGSVRARPLREAKDIDQRLGEDFDYLGELWYNYDEEAIFGDAQPAQSH